MNTFHHRNGFDFLDARSPIGRAYQRALRRTKATAAAEARKMKDFDSMGVYLNVLGSLTVQALSCLHEEDPEEAKKLAAQLREQLANLSALDTTRAELEKQLSDKSPH